MIVPLDLRLQNPGYFDYQQENRFLHLDSAEFSAGRFVRIADMGHMVILSKKDDGSRTFYLTDPLLMRVDEFIRLGEHCVSLEDFNGLVSSCQQGDSNSVVVYERLKRISDVHRLSTAKIHSLVIGNYNELFVIDDGVGIEKLLLEPWQ